MLDRHTKKGNFYRQHKTNHLIIYDRQTYYVKETQIISVLRSFFSYRAMRDKAHSTLILGDEYRAICFRSCFVRRWLV